MISLSQHFISSINSALELGIPENEKELEAYYQLRYEVLRKPWGQTPGSEKDEYEKDSFHYCLLLKGKIIGVVRLQFNSTSEAQLRFMAVADNFRGLGLGNLLLTQCEHTAREANMHYMILQARENAVGFYKQNGYEILERTFLLFHEIQHYKMRKSLT